jgi:alpha-tubulin suppressor-like RCC1 family protein
MPVVTTVSGVQYSGIWSLAGQANAKALETWPAAPGAPTIGTATVGGGNASITFTAPTYLGVPATITGYIVTSSPGGLTGTGTTSPITVSGFTLGQAYTFTVQAINASGASAPSAASNSVVPNPSLYLYSWGTNSNGQLGLGNTTTYSSPKQVGSLAGWSSIAGGNYHTLATKTDGTLWSWGINSLGELGLNNSTYYSSPKQVGALTTWLQVAAGEAHSLAIKTDNTLWAWGHNNLGQLGQGDITIRSSPVQIGGAVWSYVAGGDNFTVAIRTNGTIWAVGNNQQGQLGDGTTTSRSNIVQIGALTTWSTAACGGQGHTIARKTDGTLWTWGYNFQGQLGLGNSGYYTDRSSPNQVGALTTWSSVAAGNTHTLAIQTNGTLWSWGNNTSGQLGQNNLTLRSSPTQVGSLTAWSKAALGANNFSMVIKTDGTLWSWGGNGNGQLGLGNATFYSSPMQVGSLAVWSVAAGGNNSTRATRA